MIVSINQPAYLPWLGYFHRIAISDLHIVLDHVQFEKNSFTNRNKVRTKDGWCWLTVPLKTKGRFGDLAIQRIETSEDRKWPKKHWATIQQSYAKSPCFREYTKFWEDVYSEEWPRLFDVVKKTNLYMLDALDVKTPLVYSSEMNPQTTKSDLVLELCQKVGATVYLSGPLGRDYLNVDSFRVAGIKIAYHDFVHPSYTQAFPGFESHMAAIDLLFNAGQKSLEIMESGNMTKTDVANASC